MVVVELAELIGKIVKVTANGVGGIVLYKEFAILDKLIMALAVVQATVEL